MRKTRDVKQGEFLRPYKRILPDLISSETQLLRALSIANDLYLALDEQEYRVQIAPAGGDLDRISIKEQELERKDRKYGQYHPGSIWAPDRPTVLYVDTVPIGLAITEMTERVMVRYFDGEYHREDSRLIRSAKPWQLTHSWTREQDVPCARFRVIAYSPKKGVDWSVTWQETEQEAMGALIPKIVETFESGQGHCSTPYGRRGCGGREEEERKRGGVGALSKAGGCPQGGSGTGGQPEAARRNY
ncbi:MULTISPECIES: hypothetical protein [Mesorhizobium]|uniref:hypothetical protein n=1 Tax=Mesorhizobium TaxID=68287 RepID=UPI001FCEDF74|nr:MULTISPECIES: hypothetical protein [Mesorhizobium]